MTIDLSINGTFVRNITIKSGQVSNPYENIFKGQLNQSRKKVIPIGDNMEKIVKVAELFDIYGPLLNEKQRDVINCYYNEDLSLQEIADNNDKSKQAISDMMTRSVDKLFEFEDELSLLKKQEELKDALMSIRELMESSNYEQAIEKITKEIEKI